MTLSQLGPYRILGELGTGGMGTVYSAEVEGRVPGIDAGTRVALKLVHSHLLETPGFFKRFMREGEVGKSIRHDNLVRTYDADALIQDGQSHHFLVMEHVEGQTLRELLEEIDRAPEELCRHVGREVGAALDAIHSAGVVHRDIKPENVLITPDHAIKVMDLGVARLQDEVVRLSQTGAFVGSIHYAAPEQFGGTGSVDHRADLHALGLLLYELSCGQHPYYDEDFRRALKRLLHEEPRRCSEVNPQISPFFEEFVHTLIAKNADERFATAAEAVAVLDEGEDSAWWEERAQAMRMQTKQPLRRVRVARETALYGRDAEIERLRAMFEDVKIGQGRVLIVEGEAGIGKTRLVDEFVGLLRQEGEDLNFLFGSYPPGGAATASGAFSTAYREHFGEAGLQERLADYLSVTPSLIPAFAALLLGEATPKDEQPLTKDSLQTVFVHATRALAAERPTIVLIDDLHFSPDDGRALFAALASAVTHNPVFLIGTLRTATAEDWQGEVQRLEHSAHMPIQRLGPKDMFRVLQDTLRSERLANELAGQIAVKSDGNPFFVFEIIRGLRDGKFITRSDDGTWVQTQVIQNIQIPSTVMDLIQSRISDLSEEERDLLDVASCCGFEFDPGLVATALGMSRIPALKRFGSIEKTHRLVRSSGRKMVFDHYQVQEALYEGVIQQLREEYHAALGEALEEREKAKDRDPAELDGALCLQLCEHYFEGRRPDDALRYLDRAFDHLVGGYMHDAAVRLLDRALAADELLTGGARVDVLLRRANRLNVLGRRDEQGVTLAQALELAQSGSDPARLAAALQEEGWRLHMMGRQEEALARLGESMVISRRDGLTARESSALNALGGVYWQLGRFDDARGAWEQHVALCRELGDTGSERTAASNLALAMWDIGQTAEAAELLDLPVAVRDPVTLHSSSNFGELCGLLGRAAQAEVTLTRARELAREMGDRRMECAALHELGDVTERAGDVAAARSLYEASIALSRDIGLLFDAAETHWLMARCCIAAGDIDTAREHLEQSLETSREIGRRDSEALALAYLALLDESHIDAAEEFCSEHEEQIGKFEVVELRYVLWRATDKTEHLAAAHSQMTFLRDHAPEEDRERMIANVPIHRDVWTAAQEAGL